MIRFTHTIVLHIKHLIQYGLKHSRMLVLLTSVEVLSGLDTLWICHIYFQLKVGIWELQNMLEMIEKFGPECIL